METKNIIRASAQVVRITQLQKGNVYKRIEEGSYGGIRYGVVMDILNDGEKTFIESIEYTKEFSGVTKGEAKVWSGDKDIAIFPTTPEEVASHFEDAISSIERDIEKKEKDIEEKRALLMEARRFATGELSRTLSAPEYEVLGIA